MISPKIVIESFNGNQEIAEAVAKHHLTIRLKQIKEGENDFLNTHDSQSDLKGMMAYYIKPGGNFFIARDAATGEIAGFIGLKKVGKTEGQVKRMAVLPDYRRQGIGTKLVKTLVDWAKTARFTKLSLATGEDEKAIHIYKAAGFTVAGYDSEHSDHLLSMNLS